MAVSMRSNAVRSSSNNYYYSEFDEYHHYLSSDGEGEPRIRPSRRHEQPPVSSGPLPHSLAAAVSHHPNHTQQHHRPPPPVGRRRGRRPRRPRRRPGDDECLLCGCNPHDPLLYWVFVSFLCVGTCIAFVVVWNAAPRHYYSTVRYQRHEDSVLPIHHVHSNRTPMFLTPQQQQEQLEHQQQLENQQQQVENQQQQPAQALRPLPIVRVRHGQTPKIKVRLGTGTTGNTSHHNPPPTAPPTVESLPQDTSPIIHASSSSLVDESLSSSHGWSYWTSWLFGSSSSSPYWPDSLVEGVPGEVADQAYLQTLVDLERRINTLYPTAKEQAQAPPQSSSSSSSSSSSTSLVSCRRVPYSNPTATDRTNNRTDDSSSYFYYSTNPIDSCRPPKPKASLQGTTTTTKGEPLSSSSSSQDQNHNYQGPYYYYNPLPHTARIVCDQTIPPQQAVLFEQLCPEPVTGRLFPRIPTATSGLELMPPIVTRFDHVRPFSKPAKLQKDCDVPCLSRGTMALTSYRYIEGTNWKIIMSMEGPVYYPELKVDPMAWKQHQFYSTTSLQSEIPIPYFSHTDYPILDSTPVDFTKAIRGAVFVARNCVSSNRREQLVRELKALSSSKKDDRVVRIESVSSCEHNAELPAGADVSDKQSILNKYLFALAFENQCATDYITEKLWGAFMAGTVPVYYGAPNVRDHAPPHSLILVDDFATTQALMEYLEQVASNQTLYESYHAWRYQSPQPFGTKFNFTHTHGTCRTCRWAYARLYGLGWNAVRQQVQDVRIPRQTCVQATTGLLQHPATEQWIHASTGTTLPATRWKKTTSPQPQQQQQQDQHNKKTMHTTTKIHTNTSTTLASQTARFLNTEQQCLEGTLAQDKITLDLDPHHSQQGGGNVTKASVGAKLVRVVRQVDGVIDMEVYAVHPNASSSSSSSSTVDPLVQLHLRVSALSASRASFARLQRGRGRLQDGLSRITILASPKTVTVSAKANVLIVSKLVFPLRLRIISEDVDTFHQGADQVDNYFGSVMTEDFYHPVEVFH